MNSHKIGFILASIHTGSSQILWSSLAAHVHDSSDQLFIFPTGRLECQEESEAMRAGTVNLINPRNLDGLISWASSLGGIISLDAVRGFHQEHFSHLPFVTIGNKMEAHADISFDAYDGFKSAVLHLIKFHGIRRLAFIRGPENHLSAEDRYHAYLDSLKECGIEVDFRLISSPWSWFNGEAAIRELIEDRGLVPGSDFDALCCASDLMMLGAGRYLENKGVRIPKDLKLVGFNNSDESRLLRVPCTTVAMPYERMGLMAYTLIKGVLNSPLDSLDCPDVVLPAELIIRRSCGCTDSIGGYENAVRIIRDKDSFISWVKRVFKFTEAENDLFEKCIALSFAFPLLEDEQEDLLRIFAELFESLMKRSADINLIYESIRWSALVNEEEDYLSFVSEKLLPLVGSSLYRVNLIQKSETNRKHGVLNRLKCELLSLNGFPHLAESLYRYLPSLAMDAAFVVLKNEDGSSRFVGGFDSDTLYTTEIEFEDGLLLPQQISEKLGHGVYVVNALFSESTELGYLIVRTENFDGMLLEDLRTSLSSSVQGAYLLESSNNARIRAEKAERARSEFFSNVSEDLRDPLVRIKDLIDSSDDLDFKKAVSREIAKANHMLDLSLAQTGELEFNDKLINIIDVLKQRFSLQIVGRIPLISFDPERLCEAVELLVNLSNDNSCPVSISIFTVRDRVVLELRNQERKLDYRLLENDSSYLLAEKIMVMHQGFINASLGSLSLEFALPSFSGQASISRKGCAVLLGENINPPERMVILSKADLKNRRKLAASDIAAIFWDMDDRGYDVLNTLRFLSREPSVSRVPLYFYGSIEHSFNPVSIVDYVIKDFDTPPVIVVGALPDAMKGVLSERNTIYISSLSEYSSDEGRNARLMIITNKEISAKEISDFRKNNDLNFNIIIMLGSFDSSYADSLCSIPKVLLVNTCIAESEAFISRVYAIISGAELLPSFTGALVKKALGYLVDHATSQITRWQLAESVNVSEDYLTRIFRKEIGLSPWDYLNRYRIYLASELLRQEAMSVNEVAYRTGFQDQAYFCRVFKKIKGVTPGKMRSR